MTKFKNKKIAILGWGVDTEDIVPYLLEQQAKITVYDRKEKLDTKYTHEINWQLGKDDFSDLSKFDLVIRNPAVYRFRPEIVTAEKSGVEISSKVKVFFDVCRSKIIGVTGTKGKGTTSTLIYEILKAGGKDVYLGGNIGKGIFGELGRVDRNSWVILELSSFQLIDLHKSPHIAVVLMTTTEHQDWHVSSQEYVDAKKSIVKYQTKKDFAVVNKDYPNSVEIGKVGRGKKVWISRNEVGISRNFIKLRGDHNLENVAAAVAVAKIVGIEQTVIEKVVSSFKGLEHRLEEVATVDGVTYFNDSFSTTPETTIAAIKSFSEPTILIAGGSEKGSDFTDLGQVIVDSKNIKAVILIGIIAEKIEGAINKTEGRLSLKVVRNCQNMTEIVQKAYNMASEGDIVLLSPGAASFDMFKNYGDRGKQFKDMVKQLGVSS